MDFDITRRAFLGIGGAAAAGLAAGALASPFGSVAEGSAPTDRESALRAYAALAVPLDRLSVVSVAASSRVRSYGSAPTRAQHFSGSDWMGSAAGVLWQALAGLADDGDPIDYLRGLVRPGGTVLIKPNWVEPGYWYRAKITHPSIVFAMAALAAEAVGREGHVLVAEGPASGDAFDEIVHWTRADYAAAAQRRNGIPVRLVDLNRRSNGRTSVHLGGFSRFAGSSAHYFDGHSKDMGGMGDGRVGRYLLASPMLRADLIVDFAKAKIHRSAGVTLALKNFVGVVAADDGPYGDNDTKDVPHYSAAERARGQEGIFQENDTIGHSMADLHAAARYAARDGSLQRTPQRNLLCIIDGIVSGGRYQFRPDPKRTGWVAAGRDPVAVDHVASRCMGFDPRLIASLRPSEAGRLALGTGDPRKVVVAYSGPGGFDSYFTRARKVEAHQVSEPWGHRIDLARFTAGRLEVLRTDAGAIEVHGSARLAVVRLEYIARGRRFAQPLARVAPGRWRGAVPAGSERARVVGLDAHFNQTALEL